MLINSRHNIKTFCGVLTFSLHMPDSKSKKNAPEQTIVRALKASKKDIDSTGLKWKETK